MVSNNESGPRKALLVLLSKSRDLQGHSLVGYHLRQRYGYEVEICTVRDVESKLFIYAPDAVVIPVTGGLVLPVSGVSIAQLAKGLGMKVIVLPDAGFFGAEPENVEARRVANAPAGDTTVDCYLAWGNRGRDTLIQQGLASYDQVQTVGCPRFDFYSEPYLSLIPAKEEFLSRLGIRNSKSPFVLWNTSTTHVGRDQRESVDRMGFLWKYSETEAWKQLEDENIQFREQSRAVLELARRHPDWNFSHLD